MDELAVWLGVATVVLTAAALAVAIGMRGMAQRHERREFAKDLDSYAFWYAERVVGTGAPDPGPTDALSARGIALTSQAARLNQSGAVELTAWALDLLNRQRNGTSGMRSLEEPQVVSAVASAWVHRRSALSKVIAKSDPTYRRKPGGE